MWTLVKRVDDESYDVVPNKWLINSSSCFYPDVGMKSMKMYAKQCREPEVSWDTMDIDIIKRDFDDYDRGMLNATRFTKSKRSLTSSEEERAQGKRKKTAKKMFDDDDDDEYEDEEMLDEDEPTSAVSSLTLPTTPTPTPQTSSSFTPSSNHRTPKTANPARSIPVEIEKINASQNGTPSRHDADRSQKCTLASDKKHFCVFNLSRGSVSLEDIGHTLCYITRKLEKQDESTKNEIVKLKKFIKDNLSDAASKIPETVQREDITLWEKFPLKSFDALKTMEESLKSVEFFHSCVAHFAAGAERSSESRTVTSILGKMLTLDLAMIFTWKGQARKDRTIEKKPFQNLALARVLQAACKRCWPSTENSRVDGTASCWLAQAKAKKDRLAKKEVDSEAAAKEDDIAEAGS